MAEEPTDAGEIETPEPEPVLGGSAILRERFLIDGNKPLPDLDSPNARAFQAEDRRDLARHLFALVCSPGMPIRLDAMIKLKANPGAGVLELVDFETVFWPAVGQRTTVCVFERPMGGRVVEQVRAGQARLTEYDIPRKMIQPLTEGLRHLHTIGVSHRALRPENIFFLDEDMQEIVLGECVTAPPGFDQPIMFEPLERAMTAPAGRGAGTVVDDLYSLGASVVELALGYNPVEKMKNEDLLFRRTNLSSYAATCGNARVPISLLEPLRGLLSDNSRERWGLEEVEMWLDGRKQTPMQKKPARKADTPFRFAGRDHTNVRTLAHAFNRQIAEAARILKDEALHVWLKRSVDQGALSDTLKGYVDTAKFHKDDHQGTDEFLVARACAAMDPTGPIRYKGVAVCLDGFGPMLAIEYIRNGNVQVLAEIVNRDIYLQWINPGEALERHAKGEIDLAPPTWISLYQLSKFDTADQAVKALSAKPPRYYETRIVQDEEGARIAMWSEDSAYEAMDASQDRATHRLVMKPGGFEFQHSAVDY